MREVIGDAPAGRTSKKWVETPEGYIFSPGFQPVHNFPNSPIETLPQTAIGTGMWAEVTIPYVDLYLVNPPAKSPWLKEVPMPKLYYSQVVWIDEITVHSSGQVLYRVNELYGSYGDIFYANAEAFRPITKEELAPISTDVEDKKVVVKSCPTDTLLF